MKLTDVTTVFSKETNTVFINVVNRHKDKTIATEIISSSGDFTGKAVASLIGSDKLNDIFIFDQQAQFLPVTKEMAISNNKISYAFPPHSFTKIKIGVKKN